MGLPTKFTAHLCLFFNFVQYDNISWLEQMISNPVKSELLTII